MALRLKPHTATKLARADVTTGAIVDGSTRAGSTTVRGQLSRLSASQTFERWGVETQSPGEWRQDVGALAWAVGDHMTVSGETWAVMTAKRLLDAAGPTNHEVYRLEQVRA